MRQPNPGRSAKQEQTKSRKDLRKEMKEIKKERIRHHFKNHASPNTNTYTHKTKVINKQSHQQKIAPKQQKTVEVKKTQIVKAKAVENEDDKTIRMYEQKLGIAAGKDKYGKIAKKYGFDDDIFAFLDGITSKVNNPATKQQMAYRHQQQNEDEDMEEEEIEDEQEEEEEEHNQQEQQQQEQQQEQVEMEEGEQFDQQYDRMFDNLDGQQLDMEDMQDQQQQGDQQHPIEQQQQQQQEQQQQQQQPPNNQNKQATYRSPFLRKGQAAPSAQQKQVRRSMTGFFNKLSDGNILLTFRQFLRIIQSHPRSLTIPIFAELFTRFNLMVEKPLFHLLATNVALSTALHYAFGNRLMAPLLHSLTLKFLSVHASEEDEGEVQQFGYSKRYERMKNYATIVSLLYNYSSITGDFLQSFVGWLASRLDKNCIELLYIIIQKCGVRVRQNDPSALKSIINIIKDSISKYRAQHADGQELQKINFIELELTEIKFNKKVQNNADQRMAFLQTFILKNVPKEIENEKEIFMLKFEQLADIDTSRTNWWERDENGLGGDREIDEGLGDGELNEVAGEKRRLLELAKSFHMVTEIKKNIFLCLMDSKDFLEATQRILQLKIKNYQDVATVLVEVCTLEPSFNPYYPLVSAKLASVMPKFRLNLQYAIWDHLKLIHQYQLRRTANLAKYTAKLISDPLSNASLSILKFYPDLSNIRTIDTTFLNIFFSYFFKKVKKEYISKLVGKLREDNNRSIKEGIKEYLSEYQPEEKEKEKVKLCRRLLMLELDERKMERGDDD